MKQESKQNSAAFELKPLQQKKIHKHNLSETIQKKNDDSKQVKSSPKMQENIRKKQTHTYSTSISMIDENKLLSQSPRHSKAINFDSQLIEKLNSQSYKSITSNCPKSGLIDHKTNADSAIEQVSINSGKSLSFASMKRSSLATIQFIKRPQGQKSSIQSKKNQQEFSMMQIKSPSNSLVVPATFDSGDSITNRNSGEKQQMQYLTQGTQIENSFSFDLGQLQCKINHSEIGGSSSWYHNFETPKKNQKPNDLDDQQDQDIKELLVHVSGQNLPQQKKDANQSQTFGFKASQVNIIKHNQMILQEKKQKKLKIREKSTNKESPTKKNLALSKKEKTQTFSNLLKLVPQVSKSKQQQQDNTKQAKVTQQIKELKRNIDTDIVMDLQLREHRRKSGIELHKGARGSFLSSHPQSARSLTPLRNFDTKIPTLQQRRSSLQLHNLTFRAKSEHGDYLSPYKTRNQFGFTGEGQKP